MNANLRNRNYRSPRDIRDAEFTLEWRCHNCGRLLGKTNAFQMQIRRKPLDYVVGFPVLAACPGCGSLNVKNKP